MQPKSGHDASHENIEIISRTDNSFDLLIHESLLILRERPMLNSKLSSTSAMVGNSILLSYTAFTLTQLNQLYLNQFEFQPIK